MTDPKPLSPQAQAVLDAANGVNSYGPDDCLNESRQIAAAALRAVAKQLSERTWGDGSEIADGMRSAKFHLEGIADELESPQ